MRTLLALLAGLMLCGFGGVIPVETVAPPTIASGNGFGTLAMNQDAFTGFDVGAAGSTDPHLWYKGMWQGAPSFYDVAEQYIGTDASGDIHLQWVSANVTAGCPLPTTTASACPLPTISTGSQSLNHHRAFGHGVYQWVYKFTPYSNAAWSAGWLLGLQTGLNCLARGYPTLPISPSTDYSEIDNEWSFGNDDKLHQSVNYSATSTDCGTSPPTVFTQSVSIADSTVFHTLQVIWCGSGVGSVCGGTPGLCWYLDGTIVGTCYDTQAGTENQLHLVNAWLAEQCGGAPDTGSCSPPATIDMYIQSIRYWSCASWQTNALAC